MKIASIVCIVFLLLFHVLTVQVFGRMAFSTLQSAQDTTRIPKHSNYVEATLHPGVSAGILFGYGFKTGVDFGAGLRLGYTEHQFYVGGMFLYHFGRTLTVNTGSSFITTERFGYSAAGEIGYEILIGKKAILRPFFGLGMSNIIENYENVKTIPDSNFRMPRVISGPYRHTNLLLNPGVLVQFPINKEFLFGGEVHYSTLKGDDDLSGFGLYTTFIYRF